MSFPVDWPVDCPPESAEPASGVVFRLVRVNPPVDDDFLTHHESGKMVNAPPCLRRGLSVFRCRVDAEHQHRAFPKLGAFIASGDLEGHHGLINVTPGKQPTHSTWWPFEDVDRAAAFSKVEEIV